MIEFLIIGIIDVCFAILLPLFKRNKIVFAFSFLFLCIGTWSIEIYILSAVKDIALLLPLFHLSRIGLFFISPAMFFFVYSLVREMSNLKYLLLFSFILSASLFIMDNTYFPSQLIVHNQSYMPENNIINMINLLNFGLIGCISSITLLIARYNNVAASEKEKIKWITLGFIIAGTLGVISFKYSKIYALSGNIISLFIISYAILKHNLMDIKVFIRRSTVYGLLFIVIMSSFVYAHLNSSDIWVFIGQTTLAIIICSIALYKYSQYEIERDRKSAKIMQSEYERQLEYRTILDGVRNAVFGQAHDLKNPLNVITTFTSDVRNMLQTNKNVDKVDKYLEMIQKNCSLMQEEISRLMDRINTNFFNRQIDFETDFKQENPLIDCVNEAKLKMEDSLLREQVNVSINVDPRIKVQYLSREMLVSIIVNLFSNALRAVEGVRSSQINIKTLPDDDYHFYFLFSDNGKGIPEDKLDKLFNEGFSLSDSTGYGLYNIKRAIENELVNGCISAKCDQGETTFTLRLKKTKL